MPSNRLARALLLCLPLTAAAASLAFARQESRGTPPGLSLPPPAAAAAPPAAAARTGPPVVVTVDALGRPAPAAPAAAAPEGAPSAAPPSPLLTGLCAAWTPEGREPVVPAALSCVVMDEEESTVSVAAAEGREPGVVLVGVRAEADAPTPVRLEVRLPRGLWRVDAALARDGEAPRRWRMQSVWQRTPGVAVKAITVPPGEVLALRFTETLGAAARAHRATRAFHEVGGRTYGGASVKTCLARVGDALNGMPSLVASGKRDPLVKKAHVALLAAAQAHAMCQNARQASLFEREPAFDALLEALSEVSCAAHDLVPRQTVVTDAGGREQVRVTLTNAGAKTIPLVALGLSPDRSAGSLPAQQKIFRKLAPGAQVSALFPAGDGSGVDAAVQFNVGVGTAVVLARPAP